QAPGSEVITAVDDMRNFVAQLYHDLLHREPDAPGMTAWMTLMNEGQTRTQIVSGFEGSLEYRTNQVENLYSTLLGRPADTTGLNDFVSRLGSGATINQVESAILGSDEYFQHAGDSNSGYLKQLYHDVLGRDVDPTGAAAWGQELSDKTPRASV